MSQTLIFNFPPSRQRLYKHENMQTPHPWTHDLSLWGESRSRCATMRPLAVWHVHCCWNLLKENQDVFLQWLRMSSLKTDSELNVSFVDKLENECLRLQTPRDGVCPPGGLHTLTNGLAVTSSMTCLSALSVVDSLVRHWRTETLDILSSHQSQDHLMTSSLTCQDSHRSFNVEASWCLLMNSASSHTSWSLKEIRPDKCVEANIPGWLQWDETSPGRPARSPQWGPVFLDKGNQGLSPWSGGSDVTGLKC